MDLVLAGVGGRTVEEAKERLTHAEVIDWLAWRAKFGPLSLQRRQEELAAANLHHRGACHGAKEHKLSDYMLYQRDSAEEEASIEDVIGVLKIAAVNNASADN